MSSLVTTKLAAALATLIAGAGASVVVTQLLRHTPGPTSFQASSTPAPVTTTSPGSAASTRFAPPKGFPAPPDDAVVFAREDGADTLALGLVASTGGVLAQVSVVNDEGVGLRGLVVHLTVRGSSKSAAPCGRGCYRARFALRGNPGPVVVDVRGKGATTRWTVAPPARWPAPSAANLMAEATATWRNLHSLSYVDRLASGPGEEVTSSWKIVAPDRVSYAIDGGSGAVIIGAKRWDRESAGKAWVEAQQVPLSQPLPFWAEVSDPYLLGSGTFAGHPVWNISFYDPVSLAWFEIAVEKSTARTLDLHMTGAAHFMHDTYGSFDRPLTISAP